MRYLKAFLGVVLVFALASSAMGQDEVPQRRIVQLSGIVVGEDTTSAVPGVHIYSPATGRGTVTNAYGYFSHPFLMGDSIVITAIGYHRSSYVIPYDEGEEITELFQLEQDTIFLENVDIFPYPTEEALKQAILALRLPDETKELRESLTGEFLQYMAANTPVDGSITSRYYLDQQLYYQMNRYGGITNPFLNPFNWIRFIQDIKAGKYKKKDK